MSRCFRLPFLNDKKGGVTALGLSWIVLLAGICGLAVDSTNGFRNRAMLEATADAAALAAVIDLPDSGAAITSAVAYSSDNMPVELYGDVLKPEGVEVGSWDRAQRSFSTDGAAPDAVRVRLIQNEASVTATLVKALRLAGLYTGDVDVEAVAQRFTPHCLRNGLVARGIVDVSMNNDFARWTCIHGQKGVHLQRNNYFEPGVRLSMPEINRQLVVGSGGIETNSGLEYALKEESIDPRMVNHVADFMADLLAMKAYVTPAYIDTSSEVIVTDQTYDFTGVEPGRVYHVRCGGDQTVSIPDNAKLTGVAIISDCRISVGANVSMSDVVLGSRAGGQVQDANISFGFGVNLGTADKCQPGGGVQVFSDASIHFSPSMTLDGVQVVATGDVELGARVGGINGVNVQSGGDITLTASNMFGRCAGGSPQFFPIFYYRLVA